MLNSQSRGAQLVTSSSLQDGITLKNGMNAIIQASLNNYEKHLDDLVDSITSYNPLPSAATSLVQADDDLSESIHLLSRHQQNHARLISLRATSAALDERIKSTMRTLAESRKMLMDAAPSPPPHLPRSGEEPEKLLDARTLLSYAQHISRFTVPPTYRPNLPPPSSSTAPATGAPPGAGVQQAREASSHLQRQEAGAEASESAPPEEKRGRAMAALTPEQRAWLSPHSDGLVMPFVPWPGEDAIRRGALGSIQTVMKDGKDLDASGGLDGAMEIERPDVTAEEDEHMKQETSRIDRRFSSSVAGMTAVVLTKEEARKKKEEQEKMFEGFELYNPDED